MERGPPAGRHAALALGAVVAVLALPKLVRFWIGDPIFSLGFLVAPWAVWRILRLEGQEPAQAGLRLAVLVLTLVLAVTAWHYRSTWVALWALVAALGGVAAEKGRVPGAALPLALLALTVPPPIFDTVLNGAQVGVAWGSGIMLAAIGIPVTWDGFVLSTPGYAFTVTPLCSGMSGLLATTALVGMAGSHLAPGRRRLLLALGLGVVLTAFLNLLRVVVLVAVTHHNGPSLVEGSFHDGISLAMSLAVTLGLLPFLLKHDQNAAEPTEVTA